MVVAVNDQRSQHHLAECQDRDGQVQFELQYLVVYQLEVHYATLYFLVFILWYSGMLPAFRDRR